MDKNTTYIIIGVVVIIALIAIVLLRRRSKAKQSGNCPIDLDVLIGALGGISNISETESSPSTLKVHLKKNEIDVDTIKSLGASGIVQGASTVTMIFGKVSRDIEFELSKRLN
ncbi:MAG: LPXTG cell wall anchor domain-containing protein [Erysipelotrichaceae bacterium]|nr:LPXTG cell wall anchor domain-containing protein [Erysipelotrichaceae bacterium]